MAAYFLVLLVALVCVPPAFGQDHTGMQMPMPMPGGDVHQMPEMPAAPLGIDRVRDGSGTSWLPDATSMQGLMRPGGAWMLMLHGNAFVQFIDAGSARGDRQAGSTNWIMAMAEREAGRGQLVMRAMFSAEPLTVGRCGYPTLLASGELCRGEALHDRQHPHDLFMELALQYRRPVRDGLAIEFYGGPAGEPALGPTAFPHRLSAMPNPIAPVSHHWLDSTHVSFGVATAGVYATRWKAEGSVFNGREPDDRRYDLDLAAFDSYSGRFWFMPAKSLALQISGGHLLDAEGAEDGSRHDLDRITASATHHRLVENRLVATTVAWGQNRENGHATSALLAETAIDLSAKDVLFSRAEVMQKTAHELVLPLDGHEPFTVSKFQVGYTRWLARGRGMMTGVGGSVGLSVVPQALSSFYGGRGNAEAAVYFTIRPD